MTEINEITVVEGQQDLFTGEVVEVPTEESVLTLEDVVDALIENKTYTPFAIAKLINQVFEATSTVKTIPPQMMYNYASKGMIVKGYKGKTYTVDEVRTYVLKYTGKHVTI